MRFGGHLFEEVAVEGLDEGGVGDGRRLAIVVDEAESGDWGGEGQRDRVPECEVTAHLGD